jgi:hypothetical protein
MHIEKLKDFIEFCKLTKRLVIVPYGVSSRWCNNHCKFCYLKEGWEVKVKNIEFFIDIKDKVILTIGEILNELPKETIVELDYTGGELFCLSNSHYKIYRELLDELDEICLKYGFKIRAVFSTNLIYNDDRLDKLIELFNYTESKGISSEVISSFDLWGRFENEDSANMWWHNIERLSNETSHKPRAEMVLCKPSIDIFNNNGDTYTMRIFKKILDNPDKVMFFFENYVPNNPDNISLVPSDEDKIKMFKTLIDKYWGKLELLDAFRSDYKIEVNRDEEKPKYQDCSSAFYGNHIVKNWKNDLKLYDDETPLYNITNCIDRSLGLWPDNKEFFNKADIIKPNTYLGNGYMCLNHLDKVNNFYLNKFGCGSCKFKQYCYKNNLRGCYLEHNFKWSSNKCWKKEVFKYAENLHR